MILLWYRSRLWHPWLPINPAQALAAVESLLRHTSYPYGVTCDEPEAKAAESSPMQRWRLVRPTMSLALVREPSAGIASPSA